MFSVEILTESVSVRLAALRQVVTAVDVQDLIAWAIACEQLSQTLREKALHDDSHST